jgi:hypothetical protein
MLLIKGDMVATKGMLSTIADRKADAHRMAKPAAVGYHLVTAKTPVRSAKTGSRTSADQTM